MANPDKYITFVSGEAIDDDTIKRTLRTRGPLIVSLRTPADMKYYGGGVHLLDGEHHNETHAMTLVGHGVQNGRAYRLLRDIWGQLWGLDCY